jgi:hypothetical protein
MSLLFFLFNFDQRDILSLLFLSSEGTAFFLSKTNTAFTLETDVLFGKFHFDGLHDHLECRERELVDLNELVNEFWDVGCARDQEMWIFGT